MRYFFLASLIVVGVSTGAAAAEIEAASTIDAVTVYPDGATVTRTLSVNLPRGDSIILVRDFPLGLDPASLRVQGEGAARILIGSVDARQPAPRPVQSTPEREKKALALKDQLVSLDDKIAAATVHKNFARRFATDAPLGLGDKGDARPFAEWLSVFKAVEEEIGRADEAIRALQGRKREVEAERDSERRSADKPAIEDGGADRSCGGGRDDRQFPDQLFGAGRALAATLRCKARDRGA